MDRFGRPPTRLDPSRGLSRGILLNIQLRVSLFRKPNWVCRFGANNDEPVLLRLNRRDLLRIRNTNDTPSSDNGLLISIPDRLFFYLRHFAIAIRLVINLLYDLETSSDDAREWIAQGLSAFGDLYLQWPKGGEPSMLNSLGNQIGS
jgi:hypothetical protein